MNFQFQRSALFTSDAINEMQSNFGEQSALSEVDCARLLDWALIGWSAILQGVLGVRL